MEQLVHAATEENKNEALLEVLGFEASGSTNINDALLEALTLVENIRKAEKLPGNVQPTIIFLTDGEPTVGVTASSEIKKNVNAKNRELDVPIFGLGNIDVFLVNILSHNANIFTLFHDTLDISFRHFLFFSIWS